MIDHDRTTQLRHETKLAGLTGPGRSHWSLYPQARGLLDAAALGREIILLDALLMVLIPGWMT
ncbi:hypothetical protein [Endozoicomonas sp. G2_2]|uniref:hypothetical protein n=1 Tax=Endozoicomonas sp. G2_2 TaxID=2821092 RepID=UPI001AD9ED8A|nr:hypothetical protein [Endozoicomonas sp. G2_2]